MGAALNKMRRHATMDDTAYEEAVEWIRPHVRSLLGDDPDPGVGRCYGEGEMPNRGFVCLSLDDLARDGDPQFEAEIEAQLRKTHDDPWAHDRLEQTAAAYLKCGRPMPDELAAFAAAVLDGTQQRPSRKGSDPGQTLARDTYLYALLRLVAKQFDLPMYKGSTSLAPKRTAAEVVEEAMRREKLQTSPDVIIKAYRRLKALT